MFLIFPRITATHKLQKYISDCNSIEDFFNNFPKDFYNDARQLNIEFSQLINKYKNDVAIDTLSQLAGKSPSYLGNILNGKRPNPSRETLLAFAFVLGADIIETQSLLKIGHQAELNIRSKKDAIIWYSIEKHRSLGDVNEELEKFGYKPL